MNLSLCLSRYISQVERVRKGRRRIHFHPISCLIILSPQSSFFFSFLFQTMIVLVPCPRMSIHSPSSSSSFLWSDHATFESHNNYTCNLPPAFVCVSTLFKNRLSSLFVHSNTQSCSSINYLHAVFVWMMQLTKKIIKNYSHVVSWHRRRLETYLSVHSASSLVSFTPLSSYLDSILSPHLRIAVILLLFPNCVWPRFLSFSIVQNHLTIICVFRWTWSETCLKTLLDPILIICFSSYLSLNPFQTLGFFKNAKISCCISFSWNFSSSLLHVHPISPLSPNFFQSFIQPGNRY